MRLSGLAFVEGSAFLGACETEEGDNGDERELHSYGGC